MANPIELLVMLEEVKAKFVIDADLQAKLDAINIEIDAAFAGIGFRDVKATRQSLRFAVARIVQARKTADEQLVELARAEELALGRD